MNRGVRGATTVEENTEAAILDATVELLRSMIERNGIKEDDVASVLLTATPDITAAYPAKAARMIGWTRTALMGFVEADVDGGLPLCVRVLIHWNTDKSVEDIRHVFLHDAAQLRPDLHL